MSITEKLTENGCKNMDVTMERFINDEEFYLDILQQMLTDPGFEQLGKDLQAGNAKQGFDTAHMLKGIISNCGITPMYEYIVRIVEPLRAGNATGLDADYAGLIEQKNRFLKLVTE